METKISAWSPTEAFVLCCSLNAGLKFCHFIVFWKRVSKCKVRFAICFNFNISCKYWCLKKSSNKVRIYVCVLSIYQNIELNRMTTHDTHSDLTLHTHKWNYAVAEHWGWTDQTLHCSKLCYVFIVVDHDDHIPRHWGPM